VKEEPRAKRRGRLKNGNPPGDLSSVPRCGAMTRRGTPCRAPAMANGRCRMHGGKSTGPRTSEGRARSAKAKFRHGLYSKDFLRWKKEIRKTIENIGKTLELMRTGRDLT